MFRDPWYLAALAAACAAAAALHAWAARRRRRVTAALGRPETIARLLPPETARRRRFKAGLQLAGLALVFAALAGPQWGVELVETRADARQVFIAVDVSASMSAEDVAPSRMEKAKRQLAVLLDSLAGDRVGVIAFAGSAAVLCPVTGDIDAAKQILAGLGPASIPEPGTAIGSALRLAVDALQRYSGGRAVVLLSDGEDHHTDPLGAAAQAASAGVRVYAVGIGTPEGAPLPLKAKDGGALTGYKKDSKGQTVMSRLGEGALAEIAQRTGGAYWRASPADEEIAEIARRIGALERGPGTSGSSARYRNRFLLPLALGLIVLAAEPLVPLRGGLLLLLLLLPRPAAAAGREADLREGNRLYEKRRYRESLERYARARAENDARPEFNSGDALYRLEDFEAAARKFQGLAEDGRQSRGARAAAYYNLGNTLVRGRDFRAAVTAYRNAVLLAPQDEDARHNLAVALRLLRQPPPPRKQCRKPDPDRKPQDDRPQPKSGQPPPPAPRPQDQVSREEAERIMRSVAEKEKTGAAKAVPRPASSRPPRPRGGEDW